MHNSEIDEEEGELRNRLKRRIAGKDGARDEIEARTTQKISLGEQGRLARHGFSSESWLGQGATREEIGRAHV